MPSPSVAFVDRYRRLTKGWYPLIKFLRERYVETDAAVQENTVQITQISEVTDGLNARWGVSIDGNGQVIGLIRLDGNETGSTFTVVADKFLVAHPTSSGEVIRAFIIGQVNGVSTVGINGALLVDGTVFARHINTNTLSALSADLGTVTAGIIRSQNGESYWNLNTGEWWAG